MSTSSFYKDRILATQRAIIAYEGAIEALGQAGGVVSYTLDTGQTRQTVTRADVSSLQRTLDTLYSRLDTLHARCNGGAVSIGRPAW